MNKELGDMSDIIDNWDDIGPQTRETLSDFCFLYEKFYLENNENLTENGQKIKKSVGYLLNELNEEEKNEGFSEEMREMIRKEYYR